MNARAVDVRANMAMLVLVMRCRRRRGGTSVTRAAKRMRVIFRRMLMGGGRDVEGRL